MLQMTISARSVVVYMTGLWTESGSVTKNECLWNLSELMKG